MAAHPAAVGAGVVEARLKKAEESLKSVIFLKNRKLKFLEIEIDTESGTVWRRAEVLDLPDLSYRLLLELAVQAPAMVTKDDLVRRVWGDVVVSDETLMQRVRLLRQALGDDAQSPRYIGSVRGRGYRLLPEVGTAEAGAGPRKILQWAGLTVAVVTIALFVATRSLDEPPGSGVERLAVLPFEDLSEEPRYAYLADGLHEELLARLARLQGIQVLSRTSVQKYRGTNSGVEEIGAELSAQAIIEGSVRVSGGKLRVTVQLIDAGRNEHIWADSYDLDMTVETLFEMQQAVADRVAESLTLEYRARSGPPTLSTEAYESYLLGRYHTVRVTPEDLSIAVDFLENAVALDPAFAEAHAILAVAYSFLGTRYGDRAPETVLPKARESALRALELNDQLADAHAVYADILTWYDWDFQLADVQYRRAIALDPVNVLGYALLLSVLQRHDEAIETMQRAMEAYPDDEWVTVNLGWRLMHADRCEDAMRAVDAVRRHTDAAAIRGYCLIMLGQYEEARSLFDAEVASKGRSQTTVSNLAIGEYRAGNAAAGDSLLAELTAMSESGYVSPFTRALVNFSAGNRDAGYAALAEAVSTRARDVIFAGVHPLLAAERSDPRFLDVLRDIGLPTSRPQ